MKDHIDKDTKVKADCWSGHKSPFPKTGCEKSRKNG